LTHTVDIAGDLPSQTSWYIKLLLPILSYAVCLYPIWCHSPQIHTSFLRCFPSHSSAYKQLWEMITGHDVQMKSFRAESFIHMNRQKVWSLYISSSQLVTKSLPRWLFTCNVIAKYT